MLSQATPKIEEFGILLKQCGRSRSLWKGKSLHNTLVDRGLDRGTFLGNGIVEMYGKYGCILEAEDAFERIFHKNVYSWNILITAYTRNGLLVEALQAFRIMDLEGVRADEFTLTEIAGICGALRDLKTSELLYCRAAAATLLSTDVFLGTALVDMFGKCGCSSLSLEVFHAMPKKNVALWTALLGAHSHCQKGQALEIFWTMSLEGVKPNARTFMAVMHVVEDQRHGMALEAQILESGISDPGILAAIIRMHSRCKRIDRAKLAFDSLISHWMTDIVCWTAMIAAYVEANNLKNALDLYKRFQSWTNFEPDAVFFMTSLAACMAIEDVRTMEADILQSRGLFEKSVGVGTALLNSYLKFESLADCQGIFAAIRDKNIVAWTSILGAYVKAGSHWEALCFYKTMLLEGFKPNLITFSTILGACFSISDAKTLHSHAKLSSLQLDLDGGDLGAALASAYGRCGVVEEAEAVFDSIIVKGNSSAAWNSMIGVYAQHGRPRETLDVYSKMHLHGVEANNLTFSSVLSACSHGGMVEEACQLLDSMEHDHNVFLAQEHCGCLAGLLGRAGIVKDAHELIGAKGGDYEMWISFLGACRLHADFQRALYAERQANLLSNAESMVMLSNLLIPCS